MYFQIYLDSKKEYRWRLKSSNGNTIADSGEGYTTKQNCKDGIDLLKSTTSTTRVDDLT